MDLLFGEPVTKLSGNEFLQKNGYTFAQQVEEYFKQQGGMANSPFGKVILDKKGIQSSKQHGMSRIKASAFAAVKDVLEKGKVILDLDYYGTNNKSQRTGMIAAPIQIGDEKYVCVVEVIDNLKEQKLYVHEAFVGKTLQRAVASSLVHGSTTTSPNPNGEIAKVLQNHLNTYSDLAFLTNNGTFSALRDRNRAEQNKDNGWGNATQAEINWWKNKNIGENKQYKTNRNMNKKLIRLTESDLHRIVKESVKRIIKEGWKDVPSDIFNALNMNNANTVGTRHFGDYDAVSEKPYYQDDLRGEEPSVISIEVLKPFFINRGQGSGNFYTSAGGEQLVVLPNQTIELKEREINWISKRSEYVGEAKCSHHITKDVYNHHKFSGTGVAKIVIEGYSALLKGQEKGFIKINWAK